MDEFDFTDDEIREELVKLGYSNIPTTRLRDFKRDLERLVREERSQSSSTDTSARDEYPTSLKSCLKGPPPPTGPSHSDPPPLSRRPDHAGPPPVKAPMKRKVLRRTSDGLVEVSECSVTESESDDMSFIEERLHGLSTRVLSDASPLTSDPRATAALRPRASARDAPLSARDRLTPDADRPMSAPTAAAKICHRSRASRRPMSAYNLPDGYGGPKALIFPMSTDPHTRNLCKSDPVSNYHRYRAGWGAYRAPGERAHKALRWGIREQMLYHDTVVEKGPPRTYRPNAYIVPGDKKRKTLRWQIRNELALGIKPASVYD